MKGVFAKITAVLLLVWYLMSIIGFDVHTCRGSGDCFIVTFVDGYECEDIHPEHHCLKSSCCSHSHSCCEHEDRVSVKAESCCSSDYQVLALTGIMSFDKDSDEVVTAIHPTSVYLNIIEPDADARLPQYLLHCVASDSHPGKMLDVQSVLSVWRI